MKSSQQHLRLLTKQETACVKGRGGLEVKDESGWWLPPTHPLLCHHLTPAPHLVTPTWLQSCRQLPPSQPTAVMHMLDCSCDCSDFFLLWFETWGDCFVQSVMRCLLLRSSDLTGHYWTGLVYVEAFYMGSEVARLWQLSFFLTGFGKMQVWGCVFVFEREKMMYMVYSCINFVFVITCLQY